MTPTELCGEPAKGGPCTMVKGHHAKFHRHRNYKRAIKWTIKTPSHKIIKEGKGRVDLGYALTAIMKDHPTVHIEVSR